jgi:hypothetical protein
LGDPGLSVTTIAIFVNPRPSQPVHPDSSRTWSSLVGNAPRPLNIRAFHSFTKQPQPFARALETEISISYLPNSWILRDKE